MNGCSSGTRRPTSPRARCVTRAEPRGRTVSRVFGGARRSRAGAGDGARRRLPSPADLNTAPSLTIGRRRSRSSERRPPGSAIGAMPVSGSSWSWSGRRRAGVRPRPDRRARDLEQRRRGAACSARERADRGDPEELARGAHVRRALRRARRATTPGSRTASSHSHAPCGRPRGRRRRAWRAGAGSPRRPRPRAGRGGALGSPAGVAAGTWRPRIGAMSSNGTANRSCRTNATRSAGVSVSSTTSSARPMSPRAAPRAPDRHPRRLGRVRAERHLRPRPALPATGAGRSARAPW